MEVLAERDRKGLSFFGLAAHVLVLLKIAEKTELTEQYHHHDKSEDDTDDGCVDRHAVIVHRILYSGGILCGQVSAEKYPDTEESEPCKTRTDRIIGEVTDAGA